MGDGARPGPLYRSACTECQRRKQKCNKQWPCNHCQKRKVASKCSFGQGIASPPSLDSSVSQGGSTRKRQLSHEDHAEQQLDSNPWDDADWDFESLGYTPSHLHVGLGVGSTRKPKTIPRVYQQYCASASSCPQLQHALQLLSSRPYTDSLVQNFLNTVNFHYYIIYPSSFLEEYRSWWTTRSEEKPLGLQWTCLLLTVCACSAQHTDTDLQRKLESDLGQSTRELSERYQIAARELRSVIPVRDNHLLNVQSLLHSFLWHIGEGRFLDSRIILGAAVREAQELGIHKETATGPIAEFDREVRRRVWCILDTWDWAISVLLSRPALIDRTDCDVGLPNLTLEGYSPPPLLHVKLLSEVIARLAKQFGPVQNVVYPAQVQEYERIVQSWMSDLPQVYAFERPDTSGDTSRPWIVLHRHSIQTMALTMMLEPMRPYLTKPMSRHSPAGELAVRSGGVFYALRLLDGLHNFFEYLYPRDARICHVLLCIFHTAAVLCSALKHDQDLSIPRRAEMLAAIERAVVTLKRLDAVAKWAKTWCDVLIKIAQRSQTPVPVPRRLLQGTAGPTHPGTGGELMVAPATVGRAEYGLASESMPLDLQASYTTAFNDPALYHAGESQPVSPPDHYVTSGKSPYYMPATSMPNDRLTPMHPVASTHGHVLSGDYPSNLMHVAPPVESIYQNMTFEPMSECDLGDLAKLWNYEGLNFGFINPG